MTWREWLGRRLRVSPPPICDEEMRRLQEQTHDAQTAAEERNPEVLGLARRLRVQREQNHFGPIIWAALRGEPDV